jgi:EAL domain-containing protein (putative c-di-GMP-specific phosphodiesterase class I)/CHASE2 domain-containing sensor protein
MILGLSGAGRPLDARFSELDGLLRNRAASGRVHVVEIDARSIAAINRWPWPRGNYGRLVERLKAAGAASVAFDVDFSSLSTSGEDQAFARSLASAGVPIVLPTFGQRAGHKRTDWTESLPIPLLRPHATLASVAVLPEPDGRVRRMPVGTITDGVPRPSLSAIVAGVTGSAGSDFLIDLAIDPQTIPRHSFIDILDGRFDPRAIAGRHIIVGATAIELGDRYAVPLNGVIPGVVIQAMAAETLHRGVPRESGWQLPLFVALAPCALALRVRRRLPLLAVSIGAPILLLAGSVALHGLFNWRFEVAPAMVALLCAGAVAGLARWLERGRKQQLHDAESGMPNRAALLAAKNRIPGAGLVAVRLVDFDKLKTGLGDQATIDLIKRLRDRIAIAAGTEAVHRVGDRVLAWLATDRHGVEDQLDTLRTVMLSPIEVAGRRIDARLAVGAAFDDDDAEAQQILSRAMLAAGTALTNEQKWHVHTEGDDEWVDRELSLLGELDDAIAQGDIGVVFQPKLCLKSDRIVSVEALVRWNHRTRGALRPDLFIPLAERNDRIASLTLHVVQQTIGSLIAWREAGHDITGAVNLSAKLLSSEPFIIELRRLIDESDLPPHHLTFEVTESAAMTDAAQAAAALQSFQQLGIGISIDDYGTGLSTLSYLRQLPLDELKIDRSFVQHAHVNRSDAVLVRSTVDMAHELGLKVVAEGVEDAECLTFLRSIGCDYVQGYLVSRPVAPQDILPQLGRAIKLAA